MPRPTPRQREVLEAMSDGALHSLSECPKATIRGLLLKGWIETARTVRANWYVITEAGRRAVARTDGGA